jgi:hypothetical protein
MISPPKLVYLDHSLVTHDASWPVLQKLFVDPGYQLCLSIWNLLELAAATDRAQRAARISLIESLKPVWVLDHVHVRRQEVRRFLWPRRFDSAPPNIVFLTPHLSQAEAVYAGSKTRIGLTIGTLVENLAGVDFSQQKSLSPRALGFLQQVPKSDWRKRQAEIFPAVMSGVVPDRDPAGRLLRKAEQNELIAYCWNNRAEFMVACPTIAVDDALCEARISDPKRKPKASDGIDLAHAVMALGYCDYFVVRDGFVATCARQSENRLSALRIARVVSDPADIPNEGLSVQPRAGP